MKDNKKYKDEELLQAISSGSLFHVRRCLENGSSPNAVKEDGTTALMMASSNNELEIIRLFLLNEPGVEIYVDDYRNDRSYLIKEVKGKELVLDGEAIPIDNSRFPSVDWSKARVSVKNISVRNITKCETDSTTTHRLYYTKDSHYAIMQLLLDEGAKADAVDRIGETALSRTASKCGLEINNRGGIGSNPPSDEQKKLMKAAQTVRLRTMQRLWHHVDQVAFLSKSNVLTSAISDGNLEMVRFLLECGASVESVTKYGDHKALNLAAHCGETDIARLLLEHGAKVEAVSKDGTTAMMEAVAHCHGETINLLLEWGAEIDVANEFGNKALSKALSKTGTNSNFTKTAKILLKHGAESDKLSHWAYERNAFVKKFNALKDFYTTNPALSQEALLNQKELSTYLAEQYRNASSQSSNGAAATVEAADDDYEEFASIVVDHYDVKTSKYLFGKFQKHIQLENRAMSGLAKLKGEIPSDAASNTLDFLTTRDMQGIASLGKESVSSPKEIQEFASMMEKRLTLLDPVANRDEIILLRLIKQMPAEEIQRKFDQMINKYLFGKFQKHIQLENRTMSGLAKLKEEIPSDVARNTLDFLTTRDMQGIASLGEKSVSSPKEIQEFASMMEKKLTLLNPIANWDEIRLLRLIKQMPAEEIQRKFDQMTKKQEGPDVAAKEGSESSQLLDEEESKEEKFKEEESKEEEFKNDDEQENSSTTSEKSFTPEESSAPDDELESENTPSSKTCGSRAWDLVTSISRKMRGSSSTRTSGNSR